MNTSFKDLKNQRNSLGVEQHDVDELQQFFCAVTATLPFKDKRGA
jgi:hypothetical protein